MGSTGPEIVDDDGAVLSLAGPDGTSVTLELTRPVLASAPPYPWSAPEQREVNSIRLHVDDPDAAVQMISQSVDHSAI